MTTVEVEVSAPSRLPLLLLALHGQGNTFPEIGRLAHLSPWTVKYHLDNLRHELEAKNLTHALVMCVARGWLCIDGRAAEAFVPAEPEQLVAA